MLKHFAHRLWLQLLLLWLSVAGAWAHDPSSYGGVFRSRNLGATWLGADVGLFLNAALVVAINPRQQTHLLVGTDLGVLGSRNAGLSWTPEATDLIFGAVFAVTFLHDGEDAICAAQSGVFRRHAGRWTTSDVPEGAIPAKALVSASAERVYLLGRDRLFISRDGGQRFVPAPGLSDLGAISALAVVQAQPETVVAVIDGQIMASDDGGQRWQPGGPGPESEPVEFVAADLYVPQRLWAAQGSRLSVSDDLGGAWRRLGRSLPEPAINVRGIAANVEATTVLVSSNRGLFRSEDGGASWVLKEDNLPIHLEAGPLARDPGDPGLIYAVYSLIPYSEVWRAAVEGGNLMRRLDPVSLAGGIAFWLLLMLAGWWTVQRLARRRGTDRDVSPC